MVEVRKYFLEPTEQIPNSRYPLLHYVGALSEQNGYDKGRIYDTFDRNGWMVNWIFRYSSTQKSHYHSRSHECMAILSGTATIRFGVADTSDDLEESTWGSAWESGGVTLEAKAGDVFVIPAGVAHKTHNCLPKADFALLTPGKGKGIEAEDTRAAIEAIQLSGFTMLGAYPKGSNYDFVEGGRGHEDWRITWSVPRPAMDPVLGKATDGLCGTWRDTPKARL